MTNPLQSFLHFIHVTKQRGGSYYYHFSEEEIEAGMNKMFTITGQ